MSRFVPDRGPKPRFLGRCPACGKYLALLPAGWMRLCVSYALMRVRRYRCWRCGKETFRTPIPPWARK